MKSNTFMKETINSHSYRPKLRSTNGYLLEYSDSYTNLCFNRLGFCRFVCERVLNSFNSQFFTVSAGLPSLINFNVAPIMKKICTNEQSDPQQYCRLWSEWVRLNFNKSFRVLPKDKEKPLKFQNELHCVADYVEFFIHTDFWECTMTLVLRL
jgi:hypothetical protein